MYLEEDHSLCLDIRALRAGPLQHDQAAPLTQPEERAGHLRSRLALSTEEKHCFAIHHFLVVHHFKTDPEK